MIKHLAIASVVALALAVAGAGAWYWQRGSLQKAPSAPIKKITIALGVSPNSAPVHIAFAEKFFASEGLDVVMQPHNSGKAAVRSLLDGKADLATMGDIPFMFAVMRGANIRLIATMNASENVLKVVANKDNGVQSPQDLKGKRVGTTFGTGGHFFLNALLVVNHVQLSDVTVVDLRPNKLVEALAAGDIDAVSTWEPHGLGARQRLGDRAVVFPAKGVHVETFNIAGDGTFVDHNPEVIERVVAALKRAEALIRRDPSRAIRLTSEFSGQPVKDVERVWADYRFQLSLEQSLLLTLEDESRWAIDNGLVDQAAAPNYLDFFYFDALDAVKPGAVTVAR